MMSPRIGSIKANVANRRMLILASAKFRQNVPPVPNTTRMPISNFVLRLTVWEGNLLRLPISRRQLSVQTINSRTTQKRIGPSLSINGTKRRSEEHTSELQSRENLVCRLLLEKKKQ